MPDRARRFNAAAALLVAMLGLTLLGLFNAFALLVACVFSMFQGMQTIQDGQRDGAVQIGVGIFMGTIGVVPTLFSFLGLALMIPVASAAMRGEGSPGRVQPVLALAILGFLVGQLVTCQCVLVPFTLILGALAWFAAWYGRLDQP